MPHDEASHYAFVYVLVFTFQQMYKKLKSQVVLSHI